MKVEQLRPDQLTPDQIVRTNTLVLGAPSIGKTHRLDHNPDITVVETLGEVESVPADELVAVDDFYDLWQEANPSIRQAFVDSLDRESGVYVSTRPRCLDWLLKRDELLGDGFVDAFDQTFFLRYDPDQEASAALAEATRVADDLTQADLSSYLSELEYPQYEFDSPPLESRLSTYGATIIPPLAAQLTADVATSSVELSLSAMREVIRDFASNASLSKALEGVTEAVPSVLEGFVGGNASALTVGSLTAPPVVAGGAFFCWILLRRGGQSLAPDDVFHSLVEKDLLPHTKAKLEEWLDLPPRTLDNVQRLLETANPDKIESLEEVVEANTSQIHELRRGLDELEEQLDALARSYHGFVEIDEVTLQLQASRSFTDAVRTGFRPVDAADGYVLDRERPAAEDDSGVAEGGDRRNVTDELVERLDNGADQLVVGRPGSGKSSISVAVAARWVTSGRGVAFYRRSGQEPFERPQLLSEQLRQAATEGHVLVVVEDAVREETRAIFRVIRELRDHPGVTFLLDARRGELSEFSPGRLETANTAELRDVRDDLDRYRVPELDRRECERILSHFREHSDSIVPADATPSALYQRLSRGHGQVGTMLRFTHFLLDTDDDRSGLENDVMDKFHLVERPESVRSAEEFERLAGLDAPTRRHVALLVHVLNATPNASLRRSYFLEGLTGLDRFSRTDVKEVLRAFDGWLVYIEDGQLQTMHEYWSFLYLRYMVRGDEHRPADERPVPLETATFGWEDVPFEAHERLATCLDAVFTALEKLWEGERSRRGLRRREQDLDPEDEAEQVVDGLFRLGRSHPVLAPLFYPGGEMTIDFREGELCSTETVAEGLIRVGRMFRKQEDPARAEAALEEAADRIEKLDERARKRLESRRRNQLGGLARVRGDGLEAIEQSERAVELAREIDDAVCELRARNYLSAALREEGYIDRAREHAERALELTEVVDHQRLRAESLNNAGASSPDPDRQSELHKRALAAARRAGSRKEEANAVFWLGRHAQGRNSEEAVEYLRRAAEIYREIGDNERVGWCLYNLGCLSARHESVSVDDPEVILEEAEEAFRAVDVRPGLAQTLRERGNVVKRRGDDEAALALYQQAAELFDTVDDLTSRAKILRRCGDVSRNLGNLDEAVEYYQQSVDLEDKAGNWAGAASALHKLGYTEEQRDDLTAAAEAYERGVEFADQADDVVSRGHHLRSLGIVARRRRNLSAASDRFEAARQMFREADDLDREADCLRRLAFLELRRRRFHAAQEYFEERLVLGADADRPDIEADSLVRLGRLGLRREQYLDARDRLSDAISPALRAGDASLAVTAAELLVLACHELDEYEAAVDHCERGLVLATRLARHVDRQL